MKQSECIQKIITATCAQVNLSEVIQCHFISV